MLRQYRPGWLLWLTVEHHADRPYVPPVTTTDMCMAVLCDAVCAVMILSLVLAPIGWTIWTLAQFS